MHACDHKMLHWTNVRGLSWNHRSENTKRQDWERLPREPVSCPCTRSKEASEIVSKTWAAVGAWREEGAQNGSWWERNQRALAAKLIIFELIVHTMLVLGWTPLFENAVTPGPTEDTTGGGGWGWGVARDGRPFGKSGELTQYLELKIGWSCAWKRGPQRWTCEADVAVPREPHLCETVKHLRRGTPHSKGREELWDPFPGLWPPGAVNSSPGEHSICSTSTLWIFLWPQNDSSPFFVSHLMSRATRG